LGHRFSFPVSDRRDEERDLTRPSGTTVAALERALAGTGLAGLAEPLLQAEERHGVNGVALAALAAWQSAWGTARIARVQRNPLGWGAGPDSPAYESAAASVAAVVPLIRLRYLNPGGPCFCGPNLIGMNQHYALDPTWRHGVAAIWRELQQR
jgi:hypothetical protein